ncbi:hypothetical protein D3C73_654160 [compost metagenome]
MFQPRHEFPRLLCLFFAWKQDSPIISFRMDPQDCEALIQIFAEYRLVVIKLPAHIDILGALPREHEHNLLRCFSHTVHLRLPGILLA